VVVRIVGIKDNNGFANGFINRHPNGFRRRAIMPLELCLFSISGMRILWENRILVSVQIHGYIQKRTAIP
jgi:hypothetical protein